MTSQIIRFRIKVGAPSGDLTLEDELMSYLLVGRVTAYQGNDG